jgi:hypothetical protein
MAQTAFVTLSASDRKRVEAIAADRNRQRKHIERVRIVQPSAAAVGCSRLRSRAMAFATGLSLRTVQRIWRAHQLQRHRVRSLRRSRDPRFEEKLVDIVGLYVVPPSNAVVLSIDEKSQIQALARTQPGLPLTPDRCGTMTHDYKRHGTTTLFAALNVRCGIVIGRRMQLHRHEDFLRFLNAVERHVQAGKRIEALVDNSATHKHPKVLAWLEQRSHWTFHFIPTSGSWLNAVETFFSALTRKRASAASASTQSSTC